MWTWLFGAVALLELPLALVGAWFSVFVLRNREFIRNVKTKK